MSTSRRPCSPSPSPPALLPQARREKAIYHTLNKLSMDVTRKVLVAEAWVPLAAKPRVYEALRVAAEQSSTQVHTIVQPMVTHDAPPTFFRTDKFTGGFHMIIEAYGVARYREVGGSEGRWPAASHLPDACLCQKCPTRLVLAATSKVTSLLSRPLPSDMH
jgi:hypothetical protein